MNSVKERMVNFWSRLVTSKQSKISYMGHSQIKEHICVFSAPAVHMASQKIIIIVCVFVLSTNIDEHVLFIMRQLLM